jgi:hypothetical protein
MSKEVAVNVYFRAFAETKLIVDDDFDVTDGDAVEAEWSDAFDYGMDVVEMLERNIEVVHVATIRDHAEPQRWLDKAKIMFIRAVCAKELGASVNFPFFRDSWNEGETGDEALLRIFHAERPNQDSDLDTVLVMCHG